MQHPCSVYGSARSSDVPFREIPDRVAAFLRSAADAKDPRINLVDANLKGLPPAIVITDQIDPLRSEGAKLAEKLKAAGVAVDYQNYDGVAHEFFGMGAVVDKAKQAEQRVADALKQAFSK